MLAVLFLVALVYLSICYRVIGRFHSNVYNLDNNRKTPAESMYDGVDYSPAHPAVLMGHHFSSIAGAGPVVGPVAAAGMFGWLPAYLWCVLGSSLLGGSHDTGALVASIRHQGKSMGAVVKQWIGDRGSLLFLLFTTLTLILIVAVFMQMAAQTMTGDPAVAFSALVYIVIAIILGLMIYRFNISLRISTVIMLPIVFGSCVWAHYNPEMVSWLKLDVETWIWILVAYIILASLLPVWLLLQPRDYLASYFLYFAVIIGAVGMLIGSSSFEVTLPAFKGFTFKDNQYLWPMLFVTIACGAISGFHSMVCSGTTSKQLRSEKDALIIGYGAMLLEGLVAVISIGTLMVMGNATGAPIQLFAQGFGKFASLIGIDPGLGTSLGALAINSFILTTLDTATRLTRYQIQELTSNKINKYVATLIAVAASLILLFSKTGDTPISTVIWPIFGSANQMVAALTLLGVAVWVRKGLQKNNSFLMYPMWFMLFTTIAALFMLIRDQITAPAGPSILLVVVSIILICLAVLVVREALIALKPQGAQLGETATAN